MKKIPLIDLHQDIADNCLIISGKDFFEKNDLHQGKNTAGLPVNNQVDWWRLKKAGVKLVFAASCPFVAERGKIKIAENPSAATFKQLNFYFELLRKNNKLALVKSYRDYLAVKKKNKLGFLLHIEGADFIDDQLVTLELAYNLGARSIGLTHNEKNKLAGGAMSKGGLTKLGRMVIEKAQQLGMIIDLAHLNKRSFNQAIKLVKPPFMVSHCGVEAIKKHPRNLSDEQIKLVKEKEGVIGLAFAPNFYPNNQLVTLVKAFQRIKKLIGTENICIGSDFDGIISEKLFEGLEDVSEMRNFKEALIKEGFTLTEIEQIFYKNAEKLVRGVG
jgi:membrane dipeptidase